MNVLESILKGLEAVHVDTKGAAFVGQKSRPGLVLPQLSHFFPKIPMTKLNGMAAGRWAWPETNDHITKVLQQVSNRVPSTAFTDFRPLVIRNFILIELLKDAASSAGLRLSSAEINELQSEAAAWKPSVLIDGKCVVWGIRIAFQLLRIKFQLTETQQKMILSAFSKPIAQELTVTKCVESLVQLAELYSGGTKDTKQQEPAPTAAAAPTNRPTWNPNGPMWQQPVSCLDEFSLTLRFDYKAHRFHFERYDPMTVHLNGLAVYLVKADGVYFALINHCPFTAVQLTSALRSTQTDAMVVEVVDTNADIGIQQRVNGQVVFVTNETIVLFDGARSYLLNRVIDQSAEFVSARQVNQAYSPPLAPPIGGNFNLPRTS